MPCLQAITVPFWPLESKDPFGLFTMKGDDARASRGSGDRVTLADLSAISWLAALLDFAQLNNFGPLGA